jgi:D-alanine-D-alanine ligase
VANADHTAVRSRLSAIDDALCALGQDIALFLVFDRPTRISERPGLTRTYFAERCVSDTQLDQMLDTFRKIEAYAELLEGEQEFIKALATGHIQSVGRRLSIAYDGIGWGVGDEGFEPGRKALVPVVADSYQLLCTGSDAYTSALVLHKFHSFLVLRALGIRAPRVWGYDTQVGWLGKRPPAGLKVIAKSTYEARSVGVTQESVFVVDSTCDARVSTIAHDIGQAVTVQEFISGMEVSVPVVSCPERHVLPPMRQILARAPGDPGAFTTVEDSMRSNALSFVQLEGQSSLLAELRKNASWIFEVLKMRGLGRIDFRVDDRNRPWVTDVAVEPGWSPTGSAFASFAELGVDYPTFNRMIIGITLAWAGILPTAGPLLPRS